MIKLVKIALIVIVFFAAAGIAGLALVAGRGFSARAEPSRLEAVAARSLRRVMVPSSARNLKNPVEATPEVWQDALAHFADHCATCHGNDGRGATSIGQGLYPKAPDMHLATTQSLSDGELFYIIEEGIRFTGMPGWATGTPAGVRASWTLVHFIRRLPQLSSTDLETMKTLNPRSLNELQEENEIRQFLGEPSSAEPSRAPPAPVHHKHP
jgi:mono/diheme cytochrome c family protein